MKNTPYNLYIHFDILKSIFEEKNSRLVNLLKCGLTSLELSTRLLKSTLQPSEIPNPNKLIQILKDLETQLNLLVEFVGPIEGEFIKINSSIISHSENFNNLKLLSSTYTREVDRITTLYL